MVQGMIGRGREFLKVFSGHLVEGEIIHSGAQIHIVGVGVPDLFHIKKPLIKGLRDLDITHPEGKMS
jgi:hypothetical protein